MNSVVKMFREARALRVIIALVIREMNTRYGRTWGGYLWAVLEPIGMITMLSLAFSQFIHTPPLGHSFVVFYATGYIPFHFYAEISNNTSSAVTYNRSLMHFPMVTPLDAVFARFILSMLTLMVASGIILGGIAIISGLPGAIDLTAVMRGILCCAALGLGIGVLNCIMFEFFPVWQRLWAIINRPMFLISGIFFTYEDMPTAIQKLLWFNPLVHAVGETRSGFFAIYEAQYVSFTYVLSIAATTFLLGAFLLIRNRSIMVDVRA